MATAMLQAYSMRNQPPMVFITNNGKGLNVLAMCIIKSSVTKKVEITSVNPKIVTLRLVFVLDQKGNVHT